MTDKKPHVINLRRREAQFRNLNFQPEKAGEELVERADLDFEILLEEDEVEMVMVTRGNVLQVLWDKDGEPQMRDVEDIQIELTAEGKLEIGNVGSDSVFDFEPAKLKKLKLTPLMGRVASLRLQVRVDPTGYLDRLGKLRIKQRVKFGFLGRGATEDGGEQKLNL